MLLLFQLERSLIMAVYKISDILLKLGEMIEDGHAFVELDEYPEEDDSPALLSFNVPVECESPDFDVSDYESIDACNPNDPSSNEIISISPDSLCPDLLFTYDEIDLINHAVKNSIEYGKECIDSPNYSRDTKDLIKKDLIDLRNFYPKLQRFYNEFFKSRS